MVERVLQLLTADPGLGGMITYGFRAETSGRRIPPNAALTGYHSPWGYQRGLLDEDGVLLVDLDVLPPESLTLIAQRLDHGGCTLAASCSSAPWAHLADRVAFLVGTSEPFVPPSRGRPISRRQAITVVAAAALEYGIEGHRAEAFALRAADAIRIIDGRSRLCEGDLAEAIFLVLGPRARSTSDSDSQPSETARAQREATETEAPPVAVPVVLLPTTPVQTRPALHGAAVRSVPGWRRQGTLDVTATLMAALPWQRLRGGPSLPVRIRPGDLRWYLRRPRKGRLLIFVVDGSGSMGARRLGQAKGAVLGLLQQAYRSRDQVALILAAGAEAKLLLPPARAVEQARRKLITLPAGGATPLSGALLQARELAVQAFRREGRPSVLVLLTDGRANQPLPGRDRAGVRDELRRSSLAVRKAGIAAVVVGEPGKEAAELSRWLGGRLQWMGRNLTASLPR